MSNATRSPDHPSPSSPDNTQHGFLDKILSFKPFLTHILLALVIFFLPTQLAKHFWPDVTVVNSIRIDYLAPKIYVTDILALGLIILNIPTIISYMLYKTDRSLIPIAVLLTAFFLLTNIVFSAAPLISILKLLKIIEIASIAIVVYHLFLSSDKNQRRILQTTLFGSFLFSTILQIVIAILQLSFKESLGGFYYFLGERTFTMTTPGIATASLSGTEFLRPYGTFSHPNSMGGFFLLLYTVVLFDPFLKTKHLLRGILLLTSSLLILSSFSQAAIGIFIIMTIFHTIISKKKLSCPLCIISKILGVVVIGSLFMLSQGDTETVTKRIWLAEKAVTMIQNAPLVGTGMGASLIPQSEFPVPYPYHFLQPVHNIFLLAITELGIPLFLLLCGGLYLFIKRHRSSYLMLACLTAIAGTGMFDHYWLTLQQNLLMMGVVFGYAAAIRPS